MPRLWLPIICLGFLFASCCFGQRDLDTSAFDRTVRPQDDLFRYVNGTWLERTPIPADKSNFGSFIQLDDLSRQRIRQLIEEVSSESQTPGSDEQKVGDFFTSFMDTQAIEERGISPLQEDLNRIDGLANADSVFREFAALRKIGVTTPISFYVAPDAKNSQQYKVHLSQSGLTLPDRDYYLNDDDKSKNARQALSEYITKVFRLCDWQDGDQAAEAILEIETRLAKFQIPRAELRDAEKRYNPFSVKELQAATPNLNWSAFLSAMVDREVQQVNVNTPSYFDGLNQIFAEIDTSDWQSYLKFQLVDAFAPILNRDLVDAHFDLHSKAIAGIEEQLPRWKRAVNAISGGGAGDFGALGDVVGRIYVARYFPPDAKAEMDKLVGNLLAAFGQSIDELTWMTAETRKRARDKLSKINTKIGYPEKWRKYEQLTVVPDNLFTNVINSRRVEFERMADKLGQPVDKQEWGMTPQTVNAYYNPALNEIVFPAAILQSPFFSRDAEAALNYGGIGAVIGHEISHAFDDQGSKYDGDGNLNNWWTDDDRAAFQALADQLIAQYEDYEPLEGKFVNGKLTLGENIADLSGLSIAYKAYRLSLDGQEPEEIAGWTGDQLFFVGWSRVWRRKYRDAELVRRLLIDPHSPSRFRANGPVANIGAFYQAFDLQEGDLLYKPVEERIQIW